MGLHSSTSATTSSGRIGWPFTWIVRQNPPDGVRYTAVRYPAACKALAQNAETDPFPFVPATWMMGIVLGIAKCSRQRACAPGQTFLARFGKLRTRL